jgi:CBS domain-containing protein
VAEGGRTEGLITLHHLRSVPRDERLGLTTSQVMTPIGSVLRVHPDDDLWQVLQRMDENDVNQVPVMDGDTFMGMITRERLLHDIRLRADLGV